MATLVANAKGAITHVAQAIPFPSGPADLGYQRDLCLAPRTGPR